ncbi:conserved hypothetical protein [Candidatus Methylobacter favarea]|uniref:Uncharacterized protein n=1 Tax=Candidatus Methylobacter favarea TaxID=2707345 RepID=A0A8S0WXY3_9GAMM|nr:hypothetical protein [Candidatus Methylobacter favarea]CAA9889353.1 conserved hypothetical protein [Candidatus Methylobacter favarea]
MTLFYILLPVYMAFCLWLGLRILQKAGFDGWWTLVLLIPIVNIIMIWMFAFMRWPALKENIKQDL